MYYPAFSIPRYLSQLSETLALKGNLSYNILVNQGCRFPLAEEHSSRVVDETSPGKLVSLVKIASASTVQVGAVADIKERTILKQVYIG